MLIHISPNNPKPMYEQVVNEIQRLIVTKILKPDDMLPSIRILSKELMTSAITIRRAYQELERSGFIYTRPGKGSFVSRLSEKTLTTWKMDQVQEPLHEAISRAKKLHLSEAQFQKLMTELWKNGGEHK